MKLSDEEIRAEINARVLHGDEAGAICRGFKELLAARDVVNAVRAPFTPGSQASYGDVCDYPWHAKLDGALTAHDKATEGE